MFIRSVRRNAFRDAVRAIFDKALDGVDEMMARARTLPGRLKSRRLAMESAVIVRLADRLCELLRAGDPIAGRVALKKADFMGCGLRGMASVWIAPNHGQNK